MVNHKINATPPERLQHCDAKAYEDYYVNQAANSMRFFAGAQQQKGYGLGGVLASIGRAVIFKSGARAIGREAMRSGMQFASDVLEGQNVKQAAVRKAKQAGSSLLKRTIAPPPGLPFFPTPPNKKTKRTSGVVISKKRKPKPTKDIFS